jgi:hypothetical protein
MESHMNRIIGKFGLFVAAAALPLLAGCQDNKQTAHHDKKMEPPKHMTEPGREIDRMIEMQAAVGAKNDATLYPQHFDGGELNSLGRSKLALLMRANQGSPRTVVYMDLGRANDLTSARHSSIERYWRDSMSGQTQLEIRDGMNSNLAYSAQPSLDRLKLTNRPGEKGGESQSESTNQNVNAPDRSNSNSGSQMQDTLFK